MVHQHISLICKTERAEYQHEEELRRYILIPKLRKRSKKQGQTVRQGARANPRLALFPLGCKATNHPSFLNIRDSFESISQNMASHSSVFKT